MSATEIAIEEKVKQLAADLERIRQDQLQILNFVSHDLKAPMNRLFALLQLLVHEPRGLDESQQSYLNKMELVIADMRYMLQNLTDFRNLEHREIELNIVSIPLNAFLKKTAAPFQSMAVKKGVSLVVDDRGSLKVESDTYVLSRILDNLLSNAVKFSAPGKHASVGAIEKAGQVVIEVRDEARGFRPEEHEQLFRDKFKNFSITPTGGESATGLGLYLSHCLAGKIRAQLSCETREGEGSTFSLTLPLPGNQNK